MYIIRFKSDSDYYTGDMSNGCWSCIRKLAMSFESHQEAFDYIRRIDDWLLDRVEIDYIHPLNLR